MGYPLKDTSSNNYIEFGLIEGHSFNRNKFLVNEFFNSTDDEFMAIMERYKFYYGQSAYDYVTKKYCKGWRSGNRTLTNIQEDRVLFIMPQFLNATAKEKLKHIEEELKKLKDEANYKLATEEVLNLINQSIRNFFSVQNTLYAKLSVDITEDILNIFQKEYARATEKRMPQRNLKSFYDRIIMLSKDEQEEILNVAKYIIQTKLQKQFYGIVKDLNTFLSHTQRFGRGLFRANYKIFAFNLDVKIVDLKLTKLSLPNFKVDGVETNSRFKMHIDKLIANELVNVHTETNKAVATSFLNDNDIKLFFDHYEELSNSDREVNMKSTFIGEGGALDMEISMKPTKMLKTAIAKSSVKILIYTIILIGLISLVCSYKVWTFLYLPGFVFMIFYIGMLTHELEQIKSFLKELKLYGQ